uniref:Matrix metallopeptidase 11 n=1 Tax=Sus scrofa TaxID=9823 RepID=A0A4X1V109_PIG
AWRQCGKKTSVCDCEVEVRKKGSRAGRDPVRARVSPQFQVPVAGAWPVLRLCTQRLAHPQIHTRKKYHPICLDVHHRHPVRRGPQPWPEAPRSGPAPALAYQEAPRPGGGPRPPRCGVPDPPGGPSARNRQKRFVLSGGRWEKTDLTYR